MKSQRDNQELPCSLKNTGLFCQVHKKDTYVFTVLIASDMNDQDS